MDVSNRSPALCQISLHSDLSSYLLGGAFVKGWAAKTCWEERNVTSVAKTFALSHTLQSVIFN